jgi:uncharacterized protein (DUF362 family)
LERVIDHTDWPSRRHVVVKPNLVMPSQPLAITHRDALAAVLEAVRTRYDGPLTIAEGCAVRPTVEAFEALGFDELASFYRAQLVDLNADRAFPVTVYDRSTGPLHLRLARRIVESDCRISLALPKTHDLVLVTLSIKNMVMGSLVNRRLAAGQGSHVGRGNDKMAMHQGYPMININLALLAPLVWPHLSVLDGFEAMEGAGPSGGTPVPWRMAMAGTDPLAVDALTAHLMGFGVDEVGYLHYCARLGLGCADLEGIEVIGNASVQAVRRPFRPHPGHREQRRWQHRKASQLLQLDPTAPA